MRNSRLSSRALGLLPLVVAGCFQDSEPSGAPAFDAPGLWDEAPSTRWALEEEVRIGTVEGGGASSFGRVRNVVPASDGGVWVFDQLAYALQRFDSLGRHVRTVGRRGEGPGEFTGNACATPAPNGEIWVETETSWHRFTDDGERIGTFPTPSTMACGVRAWSGDGSYVVANAEFDRETRSVRSYLVRLEWLGDRFIPLDTIQPPELPEPRTVTFTNVSGRSASTRGVPFVHNPGWSLASDGSLWVWEGGGRYEIVLSGTGGEPIRRVGRMYVPADIEPAHRREELEDFAPPEWKPVTDFDPSSVPAVYPPFASVHLAEDQSIWVRRQIAEDHFVWEIFDPDDRFLGRLDVPEALRGLGIRHFGSDHVWGVLRDELDVQYVVRARIEKPGR